MLEHVVAGLKPHPPPTAHRPPPPPTVAGLKPNAVKSMEGRVTSAGWVNPSSPTHAVAADAS